MRGGACYTRIALQVTNSVRRGLEFCTPTSRNLDAAQSPPSSVYGCFPCTYSLAMSGFARKCHCIAAMQVIAVTCGIIALCRFFKTYCLDILPYPTPLASLARGILLLGATGPTVQRIVSSSAGALSTSRRSQLMGWVIFLRPDKVFKAQERKRSYRSSAAAKVFLIPEFSFQGSDSIPGMILAKQRPKSPTALREPLAKPLLKQDR